MKNVTNPAAATVADLIANAQAHADRLRIELDARILMSHNYVLAAPGLGGWCAMVDDEGVARFAPTVLKASRWTEKDARRIANYQEVKDAREQLVARPYRDVLREELAGALDVIATMQERA